MEGHVHTVFFFGDLRCVRWRCSVDLVIVRGESTAQMKP